MQRKPFLNRFRFILPIVAILFISSPTSAEDIYSVDTPQPNYIQANYRLSYLTGDKAYVDVVFDQGFSFPFYKKTYTHAYVSTKGYLSFTQGSYLYQNSSLPNPAIPNAAIYAFWDDLVVDSAAGVYTQVLGEAPNRQFVIEWRNVKFFGDNSKPLKRVDFEIVLHENGVILLQYRNIADDTREKGDSATIGIEDETGNSAVQFSYNKVGGAIGPGDFAIRFAHLARRVPVDVKPMTCPNPLNVDSQGVFPVAILGTQDLDVRTIDPNSLTLGGGVVVSNSEDPSKLKKKVQVLVSKQSPLRWSLNDVGAPSAANAAAIGPNQCNELGPDGYLDLVLKFDTQAIVASLGDVKDGQPVTLQLRGNLRDGTEIVGEDVVIVIKTKGK